MSYQNEVLADSPVAYWKLADLTDSSGSGFTLTAAGTTDADSLLANEPGASQAKNFDGTDDRLTRAHEAALSITGNMTLECWIKPDVVSAGFRDILAKALFGPSGNGYSMYMNGALPGVALYRAGSTSDQANSAVALVAGSINHLVAVHDDTANTWTLFVNAVQRGQATGVSPPVASTVTLAIGSWSIATEFFDGVIDEVAVYNTALSLARIEAHYYAGQAVAFDVVTESVRTGTTDPMTWTHTPEGPPKGIVASFVHGVSSTDHVVSVTYGGVAMTRIVRATDTVDEPGAAELWFLGSGIPTGAQTVSADLSSATTDDIQGASWSVRGAGNTEVIDSDSISENAANPTVALTKGGRLGWCVAAMYGGGAAPGGTLQAENTLGPTEDLGAFYAQTCRETTVDTADHTIGWSTLTSDDLAFVALCVAEVLTVTYVPRHPGHDHANPAVF